jgi:hypothetical protein
MRCSSLWTVLLSSLTAGSVVGAIAVGCEEDGGNVQLQVNFGVGRAQWQVAENDETQLGVEVARTLASKL